ncbi:MAG: hypothetical protein AUJ11_00705 [Parcubacteria group bacterium CG1_02_44_65]|nr:MAG: hypothetical protein AUJ11_00705 [Parcubacteria group bacterium CG1_02_44_65]
MLGSFLCAQGSPAQKIFGYLFIGLSLIFKQNYIFAIPLAIFVFKDQKNIRAWIACLFPLFLYMAAMAMLGAGKDMVIQLSSYRNIWDTAVSHYFVFHKLPFAIILGYVLARILKNGRWGIFASMVIASALGLAQLSLRFPHWHPSSFAHFSVLLWGLTIGAAVYFYHAKRLHEFWITLYCAGIGWIVSISLGYMFPATAGGLLAIYWMTMAGIDRTPWFRKTMFCFIALLAVIGFVINKRDAVFRDERAAYDQIPLNGIFQGAAHFKTSKKNYELLTDLNDALAKVSQKQFTIVPQMTAYWVSSKAVNPLPLDWINGVDLPSPELYEKVKAKLISLKGQMTVVVSKEDIVYGGPMNYPITDFIHEHFSRVGETRFFELYE